MAAEDCRWSRIFDPGFAPVTVPLTVNTWSEVTLVALGFAVIVIAEEDLDDGDAEDEGDFDGADVEYDGVALGIARLRAVAAVVSVLGCIVA